MIIIDKNLGKVGVVLESSIVRLIQEQEIKGYPLFDERMKVIDSLMPVVEGESKLLEFNINKVEELLSNPVILEIFKKSLLNEDYQELLNLVDTTKTKLKVKCSNPDCNIVGSMNLEMNINELNSKNININNECPQCRSKLLCAEGSGKLKKNDLGYLVKIGEYEE